MCGISAIVSFGSDAGTIGSELAACHHVQGHRGPDGEGFLWIGRDGSVRRASTWPVEMETALATVGIAFRQLTVQDPDPLAVQPLASRDGMHWIVLNGEIYNAPELAAELRKCGHRFHTRSDAEVALAAYREWGVRCFERFNGMWALLIVDLLSRRLVGSRDRLGIKPLYFARESNRLSLASEPQALALAGRTPPHGCSVRLREFLSGVPPQGGDETFFAGVRLVPAATVFSVDLDAPRSSAPAWRTFWEPRAFICRPDAVPPFAEAVSQVRTLIASSIDLQSRAAVPVGCLLSGGLDTSYVARSLADRALRASAEPIPTFSIVFSARDMSELPYIWSVLRPGGLTNTRFQLAPEQAFADVDTVVQVQGQPLLGQDLIAQYHAYRLARDGGTVVVLEGQGADELLGGMPLYAEAMRRELLSQRRFAELGRELWADVRRNGDSRFRSSKRVAQWIWQTGFRPAPHHALPMWVNEEAFPEAIPPSAAGGSPDPSLLNQYLFRLVTTTNLPTVLQHQDRSSMAHSIEGRVPFLDHRFVELCLTLPANYKVHRGVRKRVLVDAARGTVPEAVLNRRTKKTFISKINWVPLRERFASQLRDMAADFPRTVPWVRRTELESYVEGFLSARHDDVSGMWRAYTVWRWLRLFGVRQ